MTSSLMHGAEVRGARRIVIDNARVLTLAVGERPRRGAALKELGVVDRGRVDIEQGRIVSVKAAEKSGDGAIRVEKSGDEVRVDVGGRVVMPGFVDCHTHACFAGSRVDEWEMKLAGKTYLEILAAGGGIMSTVRAVRGASAEELGALLRERVGLMRAAGTVACEIKSGYGLDLVSELKMLEVIAGVAGEQGQMSISPTALLGHAVEGRDAAGKKAFVERTIAETLPEVARRWPRVTVDAYCEEGAWSVKETVRLLARARELGHPVRVHADQFNCLGMAQEAIALGAVSVDHLEASTVDVLEALGASSTYGVMLPMCGFHVDGRYANAQYFVQQGGALCLASNFNPGSAPSFSMPLVVGLAARVMGLSVAEAIAAVTVNPATLLGMMDRGTIAAGQRGGVVVLRVRDERELAYWVDGGVVAGVV